MTSVGITYYEEPHTVFDVFDHLLYKDPGDGLGPRNYLCGDIHRLIAKVRRRDVDALCTCLKLLGDHEAAKLKAKAWAPRQMRRAHCQAEPPSIADVLVLLGIATEDDRTTSRKSYIRFCEWAIIRANEEKGISDQNDSLIDDWHEEGSQERSRLPLVFDL